MFGLVEEVVGAVGGANIVDYGLAVESDVDDADGDLGDDEQVAAARAADDPGLGAVMVPSLVRSR